MADLIDWNPKGTVTFHELGDEPLTLRHPHIGEAWDFEDRLQEVRQSYIETHNSLKAEVDAEEGETLPDDLAERVKDFNRGGLIRAFEPWYRDVFKRLGNSTLPKDFRQWPMYLLNTDLPVKLIEHWRDNPKASGETANE